MRGWIGRTTTKATHWLITVLALTAVSIWLMTEAVYKAIGPVGVGFPTFLVGGGSIVLAVWIGDNIIPDRHWARRTRSKLLGIAFCAAGFLYLYLRYFL